jgi:hypothetical protein
MDLSRICASRRRAGMLAPAAFAAFAALGMSPAARTSMAAGSGSLSPTLVDGTACSALFLQLAGTARTDLQGADAQRLRWRFRLNDRTSGMRGGGQRECQFSASCTVRAVLPKT